MTQKKYNISMKLFKVTFLVMMSFFVFSFYADAQLGQSDTSSGTSGGGNQTSGSGGTSGGGNQTSGGPVSGGGNQTSNQFFNNNVNTFPNPFNADSSTNTLYGFVFYVFSKIIMPIAAIIVVFYIIYAGFLFVKSRGNQEELTIAKRALLHAVIGAAILLGALTIATAIQGTLCQISRNSIPGLCI